MEGRIARLETHVEHILTNVSELRSDVRRLDGKIDGVKDSVTSLVLTLEKAIRRQTVWGLGLAISLGVGLLTVIARSFHWI